MSDGELNINFVVPKTLLGCMFPVCNSELFFFLTFFYLFLVANCRKP